MSKKKKAHQEEQSTIKVVRYRDPEGNPTCAANFPEGRVCMFYRTYCFGCGETCVFAGNTNEPLHRRKQGNGCLIPLKQCPVWEGTR